MGLHDQAGSIPVKPTAAIAVAQFHKVHRPVMFIGPLLVFDLVHGNIHQDDAARTKKGHHSPVREPNVAIAVPAIAVRKHTFEVSPALHHPGEEFRSPRVEGGGKPNWNSQGWRRGHALGSWG